MMLLLYLIQSQEYSFTYLLVIITIFILHFLFGFYILLLRFFLYCILLILLIPYLFLDFAIHHSKQTIFKILYWPKDLLSQNLLMISTNSDGQFLIMPFKNMMYFSLEFLASGFENKILVTVPTCQFFIFSHLLLLFIIRFIFKACKVRHKVTVESNDSE